TGSVGGRRTDTIMLLHVPDGGGPNVLLSIPRDSYVSIPGRGKNKINAAYAFGGEKLLVKTVEEATGLKVDRYVETGLGGVAGVIAQPWRGLPAAAAGGGALTFDDDAGPLDVERFLMAMRATSGGKGLSLTVPISNANLSTSAGSSVAWDDAQAEKVFEAIRAD